MLLLGVICGFLLGAFSARWIIPREPLQIKQKNYEVELENQKLEQTNRELKEKADILNSTIQTLEQLRQEKVKDEKSLIDAELNQYKKDFIDMLADYVKYFKDKDKEILLQHSELEKTLSQLQSSVDAAVNAAKREQEKAEKEFFYRIKLSQEDKNEIEKLKTIIPYLRDSEPLNKIIWKMYYENPTTDLIGRVVGKQCRTGIYKLTNLQNQMCYVGQSVNIAERFKQHIKRGLGAESTTNNKLYPTMKEIGVENFSFEIIEDCDKSQLNEREKFWQNYFHAQDFGYSIK